MSDFDSTLYEIIDNEIKIRLDFSLNKGLEKEFNKLQDKKIYKELFVFLYTLICWTDRNERVIESFISLYSKWKIDFFNHFGSHTILRHKEIEYIKWIIENFNLYKTLYSKELKDNWSLIDEKLTFIENFNNVFNTVKLYKNWLFKQLATFDYLQNLYLFWIYDISPSEKENLQDIIDKFNNKHTIKTKKLFNYNDLKNIIISYARDNYSEEDYKKILNIIWYIIEWVYCEYWKTI